MGKEEEGSGDGSREGEGREMGWRNEGDVYSCTMRI